MGVTIHWKLAQEVGTVKSTLDAAQRVAEAIRDNQAQTLGIGVDVRRESDMRLWVQVDGCETLVLDFKPFEYRTAQWNYHAAVLEDLKWWEQQHTGEHYERWPDQKQIYATGFCKTQFADSVVCHKYVADILKVAASRCTLAIVHDEGDYYHTGALEDATGAIEENGALINQLGGMLGKQGFDVVKGGETKIKSTRKKKL